MTNKEIILLTDVPEISIDFETSGLDFMNPFNDSFNTTTICLKITNMSDIKSLTYKFKYAENNQKFLIIKWWNKNCTKFPRKIKKAMKSNKQTKFRKKFDAYKNSHLSELMGNMHFSINLENNYAYLISDLIQTLDEKKFIEKFKQAADTVYNNSNFEASKFINYSKKIFY